MCVHAWIGWVGLGMEGWQAMCRKGVGGSGSGNAILLACQSLHVWLDARDYSQQFFFPATGVQAA